MESRITIKGQITIPKAIRDHLKVDAGDRVKLFIHPNGGVVILPKRPASALRGILKASRHVTIEEMDKAAAEGAVKSAPMRKTRRPRAAGRKVRR